MRNSFDEFMVERADDPDSIVPRRQDVAGWASDEWNQVKEENTTNTWRNEEVFSNIEVCWDGVQGKNDTHSTHCRISN